MLDTHVEELPNMLSSFFLVAKKENGNVYNASSLNTYFQSLARYISNEYKPPIDIKTDPRFKIVRDTLDSRCAEVTQLGESLGKQASRSVSEDTMKLAFEKGTLGRTNPRALVTTIQHLMMTGFGCRAKKEIYHCQNEDLIEGPLEKGLPQWIELSERITKMKRGKKKDVREVKGRIYLDNQHPEICPVRTFMEFKRRKTEFQNTKGKPLLWNVKQSAEEI